MPPFKAEIKPDITSNDRDIEAFFQHQYARFACGANKRFPRQVAVAMANNLPFDVLNAIIFEISELIDAQDKAKNLRENLEITDEQP